MVSNGTKLKIVQSNTTGLASSNKYGNDALIVDVSGSGIYLGNGSSSPIKLASNVDETTVTEWGFITGVKINGVTNNPDVDGLVDLGTIESSNSESIYYLTLQSATEQSGVVTAEEYEKIKKCDTVVTRILQNGNIISSCFYTNKIDLSFLGENGIIFILQTGGLEINNNSVLLLVFVQNEDGSAIWNMISQEPYSFKTINGESILGGGDIIISGGSDANVQAVDTGDVIDDVNVDYATTAYVDGLVGDINSVLESIINGGSNVSIFPITLTVGNNGQTAVDLYNYVTQNHDSGVYAFKENEIVKYNSEIIPYFNYSSGSSIYYHFNNGAALGVNQSGVVTLEDVAGN